MMFTFEKSFMELKRPIVWFHYALGAAGIVLLFKWLMDMSYLTATTSLPIMIAVLYVAVIVIDRIVHGVLGLY